MSVPIQLDSRQRALLAVAINAFASKDRARGMSYYRSGAVQRLYALEGIGEAAFGADVQGGSLYRVRWMLSGDTWTNACDCPVVHDCKHAFAAAHAMLSGGPPPRPSGGAYDEGIATSGAAPAVWVNQPEETAALRTLLEERHGRALRDRELRLIRELVSQWARLRGGGVVFERDLRAFGLDRKDVFFQDYNKAISDWWGAAAPLNSPLEYWQFLALHAKRRGLPLPEFLRIVTDTTAAEARVAARERQLQVRQWQALFESSGGPSPVPLSEEMPGQVRLRLLAPKLGWEFRQAPDAPWQAAKSSRVREWFQAIATDATRVTPAALALLQEVQLLRARAGYGSAVEPQTLRLDELPTRKLLHWLLSHPDLRHLLVDAQGEPFSAERVPLHWRGRPLPDRPDDIVFDLVQPDGSAVSGELIRLEGQPPLALAGRTLYELPPPLPGHDLRPVVIPREALQGASAVRHLRRAAVQVEGLALPEMEFVALRPRLVCALGENGPPGSGGSDLLEVQVHAVSPDGGLVQRRDGHGRWTTIAGAVADLKSEKRIREVDPAPAEAAVPLLAAFNLNWFDFRNAWVRSAATKTFPEQFVEWAERVRQAGIELACDPALAGLVRPPDRARAEVVVHGAEETGSGIDWFDLEIAVRAEDTALTKAEIRLLLKARGRFVRLAGKGWRRLQLELSPEETARLAELGLDATAMDGPGERQRFHALQLADERIAGLLPAQQATRVRERAASLRAIVPPPVPAGLTAELRPYQRDGFHFLAHLSANGLGGVLADDMGLGKTVEALAWLVHLADERAAGGKKLRVLVVCPKSVVPNWEIETRRFAPGLTVAPLRAQSLPPTQLVLANYAQLRRSASMLGAVPWDAVILDEGQNIKNPQAQTARVARELRATHRLVLTGTPIENRTLDLWSLFAFVMPGLLGTQTAFKRNFNDRADPGARGRLARRVKHFMLRRTKAQVAADLPPRIEEDLFVELDGVQRQLYDAELKRTRALLLGVHTPQQFDRQRFNILQSLLRLRQICCDPRLLGFGEGKADSGHERTIAGAAPGRAVAGSAKLEALFDTLEPLVEEGHRVLVFSQFVTLLELVAQELTARGIQYLMITGKTENRQELVDRFQSEAGEPVFLLSLKAAGAGLNLTAASYVVLYDPWWNPAVEAQAIDRTHRIGQKNQVIAYRLLARNTVEEKIRRLQQAKAELARSIVQEETLATVLSLDDLRFVLASDGAE